MCQWMVRRLSAPSAAISNFNGSRPSNCSDACAPSGVARFSTMKSPLVFRWANNLGFVGFFLIDIHSQICYSPPCILLVN